MIPVSRALVAQVAYAYQIPAADVARWAPAVIHVFHRQAARRGFITPQDTP